MRIGSVLRRLLIPVFFGVPSALPGAQSALAQAWWHSIHDGSAEVTDGFLPAPSIATNLPQNGDHAGYRRRLGERGIIYGLEYTNDILASARGGLRTGTIDQGRLHGILTVDFGKMAGWNGLTMFANFFHIHNTGRIRRDYVGGINTIAAIEATPTVRLSEIWFEQKFAGGKASVRAGQLAADAEFFFSRLSTMFLQSDWPTIAAANLPSGGSAYPLSTPGVRLKFQPAENVWLKLAVLNGDPAGPGPGDPELRNRYGVNFRVSDPPFLIGEVEGQRNTGKADGGLATTLKLGGWAHFGQFDGQRFANDGTLLANPLGSGVPIKHRGNNGLYAVIDQQLYRPKDGDSQSGISVYGRVSISPSDRNLIDRYVDGGIVFGGMIPSRPDDRFGAAVIYARFSDSIRAFDQDGMLFGTGLGPVRRNETNLELTYVAQIVPGWLVQPNLQFVWHPSGDATKNATVVGLRSTWQY